MVNIGIIGIGFMGVTHYKAIRELGDAKVAAICTRNEKKLSGDWREVQGNFGEDGGVQDLSDVACYSDIDAILADESIDLIDICLPAELHADVAIRAFNAGKHVLLEKPISVTVDEADRMLAAADAAGKIFSVAHVLRYLPEFRVIKELQTSGEYGQIAAIRIKRSIAKPRWWDRETLVKSGGPVIDLHIHDTNFIQFLFGLPHAVSSVGVAGEGGLLDYISTHYLYDDGPGAVTAEGGWMSQDGLPFEHGYDVYFETAYLKFNSSTGHPPTLYTDVGDERIPPLPHEDGFVAELMDTVRAVKAGVPSPILSATTARDSLHLCRLEEQSARCGERVRVQ